MLDKKESTDIMVLEDGNKMPSLKDITPSIKVGSDADLIYEGALMIARSYREKREKEKYAARGNVSRHRNVGGGSR